MDTLSDTEFPESAYNKPGEPDIETLDLPDADDNGVARLEDRAAELGKSFASND